MEQILSKTKNTSKPQNKYTMRTYAYALDSAESMDNPNRYNLLELYEDILRDTHLSSAIRARKANVLGLNYSLIKGNGKADKKATEMLYATWFKKFLNYVIDAKFYGFTLVELINKNGTLDVNLIPRVNVIPESEMIKIYPYTYMGDFSYKAKGYKNVISVYNDYNKRNLGELLEVTKLIMYKSETFGNWSQYTELFGQPVRVGTTNAQDPDTLGKLEYDLQNMGRSGYILKDSQTAIELLEAGGGTGADTFEKLINTINSEVSKRIVGGTMVSDDGSSKSQSEVHERGFNLITKADIQFVEAIVNDELLPILKSNGLVGKQVSYFKFDEPEIMTIDEKIKVDTFLLEHFEITDKEYFNARYGAPIEVKEQSEIMEDNEDNNKEQEGLEETNQSNPEGSN